MTNLVFGIFGSLGLAVTVVMAMKENKRRTEEKEKIAKIETKIKWTLGNILEHLESLKNNPPENDKLTSKLSWIRITQDTTLLRILSTPISKDLKDDLGEFLTGYIVHMENQFKMASENKDVCSKQNSLKKEKPQNQLSKAL